ncbi:MAG TPA: hypothetical protein VFD37_03315, partial [Solirubrobacterales bacterium]|nr:hypothetical protein [Solirubrobacterales bacterium]
MGLVMASVATVVLLLLIFVLLDRKYPVGRGGFGGAGMRGAPGQVPTASLEREEPGMVDEDVQQMLQANNEMRRRHGQSEMSTADLREAVAEDEQHRSRGRGPF